MSYHWAMYGPRPSPGDLQPPGSTHRTLTALTWDPDPEYFLTSHKIKSWLSTETRSKYELKVVFGRSFTGSTCVCACVRVCERERDTERQIQKEGGGREWGGGAEIGSRAGSHFLAQPGLELTKQNRMALSLQHPWQPFSKVLGLPVWAHVWLGEVTIYSFCGACSLRGKN